MSQSNLYAKKQKIPLKQMPEDPYPTNKYHTRNTQLSENCCSDISSVDVYYPESLIPYLL